VASYSFAVISDIHIKSSGQPPAAFPTVIKCLAALGPRFVILGGDATVGNENDGVDDDKVATWWRGLQDALTPLRDANIPVLPIAGNHDYYTAAHRRGYAAAWPNLGDDSAALGTLRGQPPLYYSLRVDGTFFLFLHVVDQDLESRVESFLRSELASDDAQSAELRFAIGHVPLVSMMGHSSQGFCNQLGKQLAAGNVAAYFSGHEHLVWDQELAFDDLRLRQIHVGTASGCYHFPLNGSTYAKHCQGDSGTLPYTGQRFALVPGTHQQKDEATIALVTVDGPSYTVTPLTLRDGQLVNFGIP
jgi:3',5'-cyclic AMP phosphodiesterase CpdA